jgi:hypothetical protein
MRPIKSGRVKSIKFNASQLEEPGGGGRAPAHPLTSKNNTLFGRDFWQAWGQPQQALEKNPQLLNFDVPSLIGQLMQANSVSAGRPSQRSTEFPSGKKYQAQIQVRNGINASAEQARQEASAATDAGGGGAWNRLPVANPLSIGRSKTGDKLPQIKSRPSDSSEATVREGQQTPLEKQGSRARQHAEG